MSSGDNPRRGVAIVAPPPIAADIGIVAAMPMEVAPLIERFKDIRKYAAKGQPIIEGRVAGKLVALVLTGMGRARAQRGAERLIDGHRPRWIVSAGFAGALNPAFPLNSVVFPTDLVNVEGRHFTPDWPDGIEAPPPAERRGRLLTIDEIVLKASHKARLHTEHAADLLDMETSAVAALSAKRGVRFLSIRVVSDDATTDLPPEIMSIMGESGSYRIGAAIGAIWRRPSSLKDLLRLREHALESADRLVKTLLDILPKLS
jgi:adenosylhomocysteine nucleosidase